MQKTKGIKSGIFIAILFGLLSMVMLFGIITSGCSSKEKTETELKESTLPQDVNEKTLLDTTTTTEPSASKEEVAQKPAEEKPKPKPKPKEETTKEETTKEEPKPTQPEIIKTLLLAENSAIEVSLLTELATGKNQVGDKFRALIKGPAEGGQVLNLPDGAMIEGEIADLSDGKADGEKALIKLRFTSLLLPGEKPIPMVGWVITNDGSGVIRPGDQGTSIAKDAAIGAAAGGVIGAITGGKTKDAAKGAVIGGVAGGVAGALLHKDQVTLKEGKNLKVNVVNPIYQEKVNKGI